MQALRKIYETNSDFESNMLAAPFLGAGMLLCRSH
jgi:hypothetical protein